MWKMVNIIGHPLEISERSRPEEGMVTTWSGIQLLKEEGVVPTKLWLTP